MIILKKKEIESVSSELIAKRFIIKNWQKYTKDKALLINVLVGKEEFTEEEVIELLKIELERVIN